MHGERIEKPELRNVRVLHWNGNLTNLETIEHEPGGVVKDDSQVFCLGGSMVGKFTEIRNLKEGRDIEVELMN